MPPLPRWYGRTYPTVEDLELYAWSLGAVVLRGEIDGAFCALPTSENQAAVIGLPKGLGLLEGMWVLAHEIAHLVMHLGYISPWTRDRQEVQAERWSACALVPESRILAYRNASPDAMIAALSAHYEDLPLVDCPQRQLAGKIARIRLTAMSISLENVW